MSAMLRMLRQKRSKPGCCGGERLRSAQRPAEKVRARNEIRTELNNIEDDYREWLENDC